MLIQTLLGKNGMTVSWSILMMPCILEVIHGFCNYILVVYQQKQHQPYQQYDLYSGLYNKICLSYNDLKTN